MALPKLQTQIFTFQVPSTSETIKYRPFTVKEEKLFMLAAEQQDSEASVDGIIQIISNCITDPIDFDVYSLTSYDVELLVLNLREVSVGEDAEVTLTDPDDENVKHKVRIAFKEAYVKIDESHQKIIKINDQVSVELKDLTLREMSEIDRSGGQTPEQLYAMIEKLVHKVIDGENVLVRGIDFTDQEAAEFVASIPSSVSSNLMQFITSMPKVVIDIEVPVKPNSPETKTITIEGIGSLLK